ncbi:MAG: hypothetical protein LBG43_06485 [Treponema sp.]|jgi:hypothetical protein|nr:hypothetical protein [Treponema sp.]
MAWLAGVERDPWTAEGGCPRRAAHARCRQNSVLNFALENDVKIIYDDFIDESEKI